MFAAIGISSVVNSGSLTYQMYVSGIYLFVYLTICPCIYLSVYLGIGTSSVVVSIVAYWHIKCFRHLSSCFFLVYNRFLFNSISEFNIQEEPRNISKALLSPFTSQVTKEVKWNGCGF